MVCGWTIHRSTPEHKQVISFVNVLNLQGFEGREASASSVTAGRKGALPRRVRILNCRWGVCHLLAIEPRFQSRFAPSQTQTHFGSCDYEFPVARPCSETEFREPGIAIFKFGSPFVLLAGDSQREVSYVGTSFLIRREGRSTNPDRAVMWMGLPNEEDRGMVVNAYIDLRFKSCLSV